MLKYEDHGAAGVGREWGTEERTAALSPNRHSTTNAVEHVVAHRDAADAPVRRRDLQQLARVCVEGAVGDCDLILSGDLRLDDELAGVLVRQPQRLRRGRDIEALLVVEGPGVAPEFGDVLS